MVRTIDRMVEVPLEVSGARTKQWLTDGNSLWLYKLNKDVIECVTESLSSKVAIKLGIPHVDCHLVTRNGVLGTMSKGILTGVEGSMLLPFGKLVKTNMGWVVTPSNNWTQAPIGYTKHLIVTTLHDLKGEGLQIERFFVIAMLFDFLISNRDRHHNNWSVIVDFDGNYSRCPLYDSGFSLRSDKEDGTLLKWLENKQHFPSASLNLGSKVNKNETERTFGSLIKDIKESHPNELKWFKAALRDKLTPEVIELLVKDISGKLISEIRIKYMERLLKANREYLLKKV